MDSRVHVHDASAPADPTAAPERTLHVGKRNAAGLFYAACSRDYGEEICGCPICQAAAQDRA
jgi:hypothetical protein